MRALANLIAWIVLWWRGAGIQPENTPMTEYRYVWYTEAGDKQPAKVIRWVNPTMADVQLADGTHRGAVPVTTERPLPDGDALEHAIRVATGREQPDQPAKGTEPHDDE